MPAARLLLCLTLLLAAACTVVIGIVLSACKMLPSSGIIYFSEVDGNNLHILDPQHLVHYNLTTRQNVYANNALSPDGGRLAFGHRSELRSFDLHTAQTTTLYTTPNSSIDAIYSWSPSGRYVGFRISRTIFKYDFLTGEVSPIIVENRDDY